MPVWLLVYCLAFELPPLKHDLVLLPANYLPDDLTELDNWRSHVSPEQCQALLGAHLHSAAIERQYMDLWVPSCEAMISGVIPMNSELS